MNDVRIPRGLEKIILGFEEMILGFEEIISSRRCIEGMLMILVGGNWFRNLCIKWFK